MRRENVCVAGGREHGGRQGEGRGAAERLPRVEEDGVGAEMAVVRFEHEVCLDEATILLYFEPPCVWRQGGRVSSKES